MSTITVSAEPLREILIALNGPHYLLREMQAIRSIASDPIGQLVEEFNAGGLEHGFHLSTDRSAAVGEHHYLPMTTCPKAVKVLLLGPGHVATLASWDGQDTQWLGWYPLPKEKRNERRTHATCRGLRST